MRLDKLFSTLGPVIAMAMASGVSGCDGSNFTFNGKEGVPLSDATYAELLALRVRIRRFQRWSEEAAKAAGLTPAQHQLLLAVRGHGGEHPTMGDLADYLLLKHHSVVGLVDRAEQAGLVERVRSDADQRVVRVRVSAAGAARLERLTEQHVEEIERLGRPI